MAASPSELFPDFDLYRVDSFESRDSPEEAIAQLVSSIRVAHALNEETLWCIASDPSAASSAPGIAWVVGLTTTSQREDRDTPLMLPPGATTSALSAAQAQLWASYCDTWVWLEAVVMPKDDAIESEELRHAILAQLAHRRFACIVRAVPATVVALENELRSLDQLARGGQLQGRAEFASSRSVAELAVERHRDLAAARQLGGWLVEVRVGSNATDITIVTELLANVLEIPGISFRAGDHAPAFIASQISTEGSPPSSPQPSALDDWRSPGRVFLASSRQIATIVRGPSREVPGVALRQPMPFDLNAESDSASSKAERDLELGAILDSTLRAGNRFSVSQSTLNRHALVCGATGSGKSQTVQVLLHELTTNGIPWLVIEPAKSEYRSMQTRLRAAGLDSPVHVLRLGDSTIPPLGLNPLEPEDGFPLQTHLDMVAALFIASFDAAEPFPQILSEALRRCYSDLGWQLATGDYKLNERGTPSTRGQRYPRYPTLADLQRTARDVVHDVGYGKEIRDNVIGFVDVRLGSLSNGTPGRFFTGGHPLGLAALHGANVVIEIEDVGNDLDKAFVIGTVILRLYEYLRVRGPTPALSHVTVVEEAHRLLRRAEPGGKQNQAVELFGAMLSEVRAFGEGIVIAEQIPTKILPDVLKNTALQIVHRLPSVEDRTILAGTTNMDPEQSAFVLSLRPGHAAAFREGMDSPVLLKVDDRRSPSGIDATTAAIGALRKRLRASGCHEQCTTTPCTGRILEQSSEIVTQVPELQFWLELTFLAFVTETVIPRPGRVWTSDLQRRLDDPVARVCAINRLAEDAVEARWAQIADFYDPTRLINAIADAARRTLFDGERAPETVGFAAGRFVVRDVYEALLDAGESAEPHPRTEEWRAKRGIDLVDAAVPIQRAWLELGSSFTYRGHERMLRGIPPATEAGPKSRIEALALPLAQGATGTNAIETACNRTTPDKQRCLEHLADWLPSANPEQPVTSS